MSRAFEEKLENVIKWYHYNKDRIPKDNLAKRLDFMTKANDCILELLTYVAEDLQVAENRKKSNTLWLPADMQVNGDLTRFE